MTKSTKIFEMYYFFAQNAFYVGFSEQSSASTTEKKQEWEPLIRDILLSEK